MILRTVPRQCHRRPEAFAAAPLASRRHRVRAATRDPAAFPLTTYPGVEAVAADFADQVSLDRAAERADGMSQLVTGSAHFVAGSMYDRIAEFYRWHNAQPVSPLAVDLRPVLADLAVRPTPMLVWAKEQDWTL